MTYLLRVNLDISNANSKDSPRLQSASEALKTIPKGNRTVILSHRGRPQGKDVGLSLKPFAKTLGATFIPHFDFAKISKAIEKSPKGSIFLLENLRFLPGETRGDKVLARKLASLGNKLINDDFPTSHHVNASNVALAKLLPSSLGPHFKAELRALDKVMQSLRKPFILVVGGAKINDKLGVIKNLLAKVDAVLLGGGPANTLLKARGVKIGRSLHDQKVMKTLGPMVNNEKLITPVDWRVKKGTISDIGSQTEKLYRDILSGAGTIIWNGPMGKFEDKAFANGTRVVAKAIFSNKHADIVIGGGDTAEAISSPQKLPRNVFVSTGGGAMLTYLSGKELPALRAIK